MRGPETLSLAAAVINSKARLLIASAILFAGHVAYIYSLQIGGERELFGVPILWISATPFLLLSVFDFRSGLILSVAATPLFHLPPIPHFFTQGLGDLFAVATIIGFLLRYRVSKIKFEPRYAILFAIPAVALISFLFWLVASDGFVWELAKYGLAEIAGLMLATGYAFLLAVSLNSKEDLNIFFASVFTALSIAIFYGVASLYQVVTCSGGLGRAVLNPGGQVAGGFGNPNYFASYLLLVFPVAIYFYHRNFRCIHRYFYAVILLLESLLLVMTVSRVGLIGLISLLVAWFVVSQDKYFKFLPLALFVLVIIFFSSGWQYRFKACSDKSDCGVSDYISSSNSLRYAIDNRLVNVVVRKTDENVLTISSDHNNVRGYERIYLLISAFDVWVSSPLLGVGPGLLAKYIDNGFGVYNRAHNSFLTILAEQGLIGLLPWLILWAALVRRAFVCATQQSGDENFIPDYKYYLLMGIVMVGLTSLFADQYRVIWFWQFVGLLFSRSLSK